MRRPGQVAGLIASVGGAGRLGLQKAMGKNKPRRPLAAFDSAPDPTDVSKYPGTLEGDAKAELNQVQQGFIERMKAEQKRFLNATDGGYYFVAVFETSEQANHFLKMSGVDRTGDLLFVDGRVLADAMGIDLPKGDVRYNIGGKGSFGDLVRKPKRRAS